MEQVADARGQNKFIDRMPARTDMSADDVLYIVTDASTEDVVRDTMDELSDELIKYEGLSFGQVVDHINMDLDKANEEGGV